MYKLLVLACVLAVAAAAPKPGYVYSPAFTNPFAAPLTAAYTAPAPLAYSAYTAPLAYSYGYNFAAPYSAYYYK
ncbi:unnamed protein product [Chrysodeixis includens]|uniref:Neuropeptide-like 4 n=1 Tax=Chrysodeixis includens TaxID=689277 RepID=A0A9P0BID1_CHRIL|nr:unnamed protein product [Chrysodeixis includens]